MKDHLMADKCTRSGPTITFPETEELANAVFGPHGGNKEVNRMYARRIVACVNACAGISTDGLEISASPDGRPLKEIVTSHANLLRVAKRFISIYEENDEDEWDRDFQELAEDFRSTITKADAQAEGIESLEFAGHTYWRDYSLRDEDAQCSPMLDYAVESYQSLWDQINGHGSWAANPWVWVVEFRTIERTKS